MGENLKTIWHQKWLLDKVKEYVKNIYLEKVKKNE